MVRFDWVFKNFPQKLLNIQNFGKILVHAKRKKLIKIIVAKANSKIISRPGWERYAIALAPHCTHHIKNTHVILVTAATGLEPTTT